MTLTLGSVAPMTVGVVSHAHKALTIKIPSSSSGCCNRSRRTPSSAKYMLGDLAMGHTITAATSSTRISSPVKTAVAAVDSSQLSSSDLPQQQSDKKYYFLVANAKFMLDEEEHFKELLFERLRNYRERSKEQDFWLVIEPKFLDEFPNITKRLRRPAVALVSTNGPWITFMKLRLDRVLAESYEANSLEEALASNPINLEFGKPENWVAPYPKYEFGWWEPFLPSASAKLKE